MMEIVYLGPVGSYSYCAAKKYREGLDFREQFALVPKRSFREVVCAVEESDDVIGILPLENSTEGIVTPVVDLLYESEGTEIIAEVILPIRHVLLNVSGNPLDIKKIYSNPQPLEQCKKNLGELLPEAELLESSSSSEACKIAKEEGSAYGAVSNVEAGAIYGLKVAAKNLQDNEKNATRFVILKKDGKTYPTGRDKTSIVFTFHGDSSGSLYRVLKEFAEWDINLIRIESRPMKETLGTYVFYIDFAGHAEEERSRLVLEKVRKQVKELKIMGAYPIGTAEEMLGKA